MNDADELTRIRNYIASKLSEGVPEGEIRAELLRLGMWPEEMINNAFVRVADSGQGTPGETNVFGPQTVNAEGNEPQSYGNSLGMETESQYGGGTSMESGSAGTVSASNKPVRSHRYVLMAVGFFALVVVSGAFALSYSMIMPTMLSDGPYTEEDFLQGMAVGFGKIKTASYGLSGSLAMEPRDPDARPFSSKEIAEYRTYREQYARDRERIDALYEIRYELQSDRSPGRMMIASEWDPLSPEVLPSLGATDPLTGQPYVVESRDDGTGFLLTITFETPDAIQAISRGIPIPPSQGVVVEGLTASFTASDVFSYYYLPLEPPQPFLMQLSESARFLPPDLDASVALKVAAEEVQQGTNMDITLDLDADFGDMTYKVAIDVRQVNDDYYIRVRNMPGFFLPMLGLQKGVWVHISQEAVSEMADEYGSGPVSMLGMQELEEDSEEVMQETIEMIKTLIRTADEERVIAFRTQPSLEKVEGRDLYKYDLTIRKDSIVPFMRRLGSLAEEQEVLGEFFSEKETMLRYLESESFSEVFDYLEDNISLLAYTTKRGEPTRIEVSMRLVPPDTAKQLAGRQGRIRLTFDINDINAVKKIQAPSDAIPFQQLMEDAQRNIEYGKKTPVIGEAIDMTANALSAWMSSVREE